MMIEKIMTKEDTVTATASSRGFAAASRPRGLGKQIDMWDHDALKADTFCMPP